MELVFYLLQLLSPEQLSETSQKASVESFKVVHESYNTQVYLDKESNCLARILYNEARGESLLGKKLVAQVTVNRSLSNSFPDSICENMKSRGSYSFYNPKSKSVDKVRKYPVEYTHIAKEAIAGKYKKLISSDTLYFKNCSVNSSFFNKLKMVKTVGKHCFFKERSNLIAKN